MKAEPVSKVSDSVRLLAKSIASCSEISNAVSDGTHPCAKIVSAQRHLGTEFRQSPEPWAGDLEHARVLFIASNPSISEAVNGENYPKVAYSTAEPAHPDWNAGEIVDFHTLRFDQSRERPFVTPGSQFLCTDGNYRGSDRSKPGKGSQTYWRNAFKEAAFILGRHVDISQDVCLTEVVHCKSKKETDKNGQPIGLEEALPTCVGRYLARILSLSDAVVVVIVGKVARLALGIQPTESDTSQVRWDIDRDKFGQLPKFKGDAAAHIGVLHTSREPKILCAMRHLSNGYGCGSFTGALGAESANRLALLVQSVEGGVSVVPDNRDDLLKQLGLGEAF